jgi:hypothetical protein
MPFRFPEQGDYFSPILSMISNDQTMDIRLCGCDRGFTSWRSAGDQVGGRGILFLLRDPMIVRIWRNAERACIYAGERSATNFRACF